jgi:chemotaxis protein methyltransferase CheR
VRRNPAFPVLKDMAVRLTGLHYWDDKEEALADLLAPLAETRRGGVDGLIAKLGAERGDGPLSRAVVDAVTVGETFFFRYREQFDALERVVIPEVMTRNHARRRLSLWSAGCSNGAEPYSLSILLLRRFGVPLMDWTVDILGSDISAGALAMAEAGVYGAWTVRDLPAELRRECFAAEDGLWRVRPRYRQWVRFVRHNLISQPPPAQGFDVVLCRNVLMYFDAATRRRVLGALYSSLDDGGWLVVGHAETGPETEALFRPVHLPGCTLYRKPVPGAEKPGPEAPKPEPPSPQPPENAPDHQAEVRRLLDQGAFDAAARQCQDWIAHAPLEPAGHYFLGLALENVAEDQSMAAFRRALFLAPDLAMAHFHLLRLLQRRGEARAARRHHAALISELDALPSDRPLRLGGGVTAGELAAVISRMGRNR